MKQEPFTVILKTRQKKTISSATPLAYSFMYRINEIQLRLANISSLIWNCQSILYETDRLWFIWQICPTWQSSLAHGTTYFQIQCCMICCKSCLSQTERRPHHALRPSDHQLVRCCRSLLVSVIYPDMKNHQIFPSD